jgi:hypothetical protein
MTKPTKISGYEFVYRNQFNNGHATTRVANNANNVAGDGIKISTMEPNLRMKTKGPATSGMMTSDDDEYDDNTCRR